ncbi:tRNA pseudouridine32 synthase / 23S rRNA pseudouridine746 synthase [Actinacidiphila rubida]|uniref:RNA pseudouridylate synthase n=1 Tax=Actinacidiphila rubida TaxID=310780 RepID=A0A1H8DP82_9ACTN|nr:pseudouridine synthase [Actinacidiphila rubida]SEN09023.1 tRNA pseudouridine32 synthase / 23S rRNA pseudouridine746 synthase [Actinacidiphila rubida]
MARRPGRKAPPAPLAQRAGVDPVRLRLPGAGNVAGADPGDVAGAAPGGGIGGAGRGEGDWPTVRAYLYARYGAAVGVPRLDAMLADGAFVTEDGPVDAATPYRPGAWVWFHRDLEPERPVPFAVEVVYRDERIVVADKPHFLATMPRGRHVTETALARLRRDLGVPQLAPAHRLDRLTAGLALFVVRPQDRGAYQTLFRDRRVRKEYEAVAAYDPAVVLPRTVRSRIVKDRGVIAAREEPGPPNAESRVQLLEHRGVLGRYRLVPATGRTHQLRVHMNALGLPLLHDPVYPRVLPERADEDEDFGRPLQLLARALEFTDPLSGRAMRFASTRELSAWPADGNERHLGA